MAVRVYIYIQYTITPCLSMNTNTSLSIQIIPNLIVPNQMVLRKVYHFLLIVQNTRFSGNSFKEHVLLSWLRLLKISGSKQWALWPRVKRKLLVDGSEIRQTHQLRLVVYPIMYKVLYIYIVYIYIYPRWCRISSINSMLVKRNLFWSSPKGWRWWSQKLDGICVNGRGSNSSTSTGACSPDIIISSISLTKTQAKKSD